MMKFHGLNESDSGEESKGEEVIVTIEAKEDNAICQLNEAFELVASGDKRRALFKFNEVLNSPFVEEASQKNSKDPSFASLQHLQYSCYKNIAVLLEEDEKHSDALDCYLYAVEIDGTDVIVWYKLGKLALKVRDFALARQAFEQGFRVQPMFWPCLDQLITLLFAIFDYLSCLHYIQAAFKRDAGFLKGHVIRDAILRDQPTIKEDFSGIFKDVSLLWDTIPYDESTSQSFINDALEIRKIRFQERPLSPLNRATLPVERPTYESLGNALIQLYDSLTEDPKGRSFTDILDIKVGTDILMLEGGSDAPSEVPSEVDDVELIQDGSDAEALKNLKRKRSLNSMEAIEKRIRLTRSKHAQIRHEEESESLRVELRSFLPTSLLGQTEAAALSGTTELRTEDPATTRQTICNLAECQTTDIVEFATHFTDSNLLTIMWEFLTVLSEKWDYKWPSDLGRIFCEVYMRIMNHRRHPDYVHNNGFSDYAFAADLRITLLSCELRFVLKFPNERDERSLFADPLTCDLTYLSQTLIAKQDLFKELEVNIMRMRAYYLKSAHCEALGWIQQSTEAADSVLAMFDECQKLDPAFDGFFVKDKSATLFITRKVCEGNLQKLEKSIEMSEIPALFSKSEFSKIVSLVKSSFQLAKEARSKGIERANEIATFVESLFEMKEYKECLLWCEASLNECLEYYTSAAIVTEETSGDEETKKSDREEECRRWARLICGITDFMEDCIREIGIEAFSSLDAAKAHRLAENLISIACHQLDLAEASLEPHFESMSPLILLHRLIAMEEEKRLEEEGHFLNLEFLGKIHDLLGKQNRCAAQEGRYLLYSLNVFVASLEISNDDAVCQYLEQCAFCLFRHQSKRPKLKNFQDHAVPGIAMTWESAKLMAEYFYPDKVPEFDSKTAVSGDVFDLAKKVVSLFPQDIHPGKTLEALNAFIRGHSETAPAADSACLTSRAMDSYYLLGDFFFKNGDFQKARKHYKIDLCYRPERFSSWVGIALALAKEVEDEIDSCHKLKSVDDLLDRSESAIRCFKSAFRLGDFELSVWIELGSFAYVMHSFCKRYVNSSEGVDLNMDEYERIEKNIGVMLSEAKTAFETSRKLIIDMALEPEELWYVEYMLGKISEKTGQPPSVWIPHYLAAAEQLFERGASYPKKVNYNSPQKYAVEAVEMHYRLHASILKYLLALEGEPLDPEVQDLFLKTILIAADSPFVKQAKKVPVEQESSRKRRRSLSPESDFDSDIVVVEEDEQPTTKLKESLLAAQEAYQLILNKALTKIAVDELKVSLQNSPDVIALDDEEEPTAAKTNPKSQLSQGRNDHWPLIQPCLEALILCVTRFTQHFKSLYRISHYYYNTKFHQNLDFSRNALLSKPVSGTVELPPETAKKRILPKSVGGLFCLRNLSNFFNGVWRNPVPEINRSGSFAAQMSRSISLFLDVLRETKDYRTLMETSLALRGEPDDDKKYLNETERKEYATTAFMFMVGIFRDRIKAVQAGLSFPTFAPLASPNQQASPKTQSLNIVMDIYRCYCRVEKDMMEKVGDLKPLILEAYKVCRKDELAEGHNATVSEALEFCKNKQAQVRRVKRLTVTQKNPETAKDSFAAKIKRVRSSPALKPTVSTTMPVTSTPAVQTAISAPLPRHTPPCKEQAVAPPKPKVINLSAAEKPESPKLTTPKPPVLPHAQTKPAVVSHDKVPAPMPVSDSKLSEISSVYSSMLAKAVSRYNLEVEVRSAMQQASKSTEPPKAELPKDMTSSEKKVIELDSPVQRKKDLDFEVQPRGKKPEAPMRKRESVIERVSEIIEVRSQAKKVEPVEQPARKLSSPVDVLAKKLVVRDFAKIDTTPKLPAGIQIVRTSEPSSIPTSERVGKETTPHRPQLHEQRCSHSTPEQNQPADDLEILDLSISPKKSSSSLEGKKVEPTPQKVMPSQEKGYMPPTAPIRKDDSKAVELTAKLGKTGPSSSSGLVRSPLVSGANKSSPEPPRLPAGFSLTAISGQPHDNKKKGLDSASVEKVKSVHKNKVGEIRQLPPGVRCVPVSDDKKRTVPTDIHGIKIPKGITVTTEVLKKSFPVSQQPQVKSTVTYPMKGPGTTSITPVPGPSGSQRSLSTGRLPVGASSRAGLGGKLHSAVPGGPIRSVSQSPAKRKASMEEVMARASEFKKRRDEFLAKGLLEAAASNALKAALGPIGASKIPAQPSTARPSLPKPSLSVTQVMRQRGSTSKDQLGLSRLANLSVVAVPKEKKSDKKDDDIIVLD